MKDHKLIYSFAIVAMLFGVGLFLFVRSQPVPKREPPQPAENHSVPVEQVTARFPSTLIIETSYPGANAQTVADTVAAPIEQQINGVEQMLHLSSQCTNEGSYVLNVTFAEGVDLQQAQVLVQNRVNHALPVLPELVKRHGITVKKKSHPPLMFVALYSSDGRYDIVYLSNYAKLQIKDELSRLHGVGAVDGVGQSDLSWRVWLDPEKLAARQLTAADAVEALKQQNLQVQPGSVGGKGPPFSIAVAHVVSLGRLSSSAILEDCIVKTDSSGRIVRLKDLARVELGASSGASEARFDGRPVVFLSIRPLPEANKRELSSTILNKLGQLRAVFPQGLDYIAAFKFEENREAPGPPATPEYLAIDVNLPDSASRERIVAVLDECTKLLMNTAGVAHVLASTEDPFSMDSNQPCLWVSLDPREKRPVGREQLIQDIRTKFTQQISGALIRVRDLSRPDRFSFSGYPIELAVHGPEIDRLRAFCEQFEKKLRAANKLTDVWLGRSFRQVPQLSIEVDREALKALGISADTIFNTLQSEIGSIYVSDFNQFGRSLQIIIREESKQRHLPDGLKQLKVRNKEGQLVPLGAVVQVRELLGPMLIERFDLEPMVRITANPAPGASLAEAHSLCESVWRELALPDEYKMTWLK